MYKKAILTGVMVAGSAGFWVLMEKWLASPFKFSLQNNGWIWMLAAFIIFVALEGLFFIFIKEKKWLISGILLSGVAYLAIFGASNYILLAFGVFLVLQWSSASNVRSEIDERLKVNIKEIVNHGLPNAINALLVMLSFAYFLLPSVQMKAQEGQLPPSFQQIVERALKEFAGEELRQLPPEQQQSFVSQTADEVISRFNQVLGPYFQYLPPVLAFGLFLILRSLTFIYIWLASLVLNLIIRILKKSGFIRIQVVQKEAEILEL